MDTGDRILILAVATMLIAAAIWGWIILPNRIKRGIALAAFCIVLIVGAIANSNIVSNPPLKPTAYFQEHAYSYDTMPRMMTDSSAMWNELLATNLAVVFSALIPLALGGIIFPFKPRRASEKEMNDFDYNA